MSIRKWRDRYLWPKGLFMKNSCIVLEGGGLRGAFTSGVMEYLLEKDLNFERVIGVSAGACIGASYVSKQKGRNLKVNMEYPSDKRFMGLRHLPVTGSYFNMEFVFNELPTRLVPFDETSFYKNLNHEEDRFCSANCPADFSKL